MSFTRKNMIDFKREALAAGDLEQARLCDLALAGDSASWAACERALQASLDMDDDFDEEQERLAAAANDSAREAGLERWARAYDELNGAPGGDDDR